VWDVTFTLPLDGVAPMINLSKNKYNTTSIRPFGHARVGLKLLLNPTKTIGASP